MKSNFKIDIEILFTRPEIFIAKKKFNNKLLPCIENKCKWYIYYYYIEPSTGKLIKIKRKFSLNTFKNLDTRTLAANILREEVEIWLLEGYSPFKYIEEIGPLDDVLWTKPEIYIAKRKVKGKLCEDILQNWFVFYFYRNPKTARLDIFREEKYIDQTQKVNERLIALENLRSKTEQILISGFNPFDKEEKYNISIEEYKEVLHSRSKKEKSNTDYPLVFTDLNAESLFKKFLLKNRAVSNENKPLKGRFQPLCAAFFKTAVEHKEIDVFIPSVLSKDYIEMLVELYLKKKINKLSAGTNYLRCAQKYLDEEIKKYPQNKVE